jgi:hypothetical protein
MPFWKQPNVWWAPILLAILTGVGWLIKQHVEDSHKLAIILGRVEPPPPNIAIYLDSKKITETSVSGWYRAENISPGEHEIEWSIGDKQFKTIPVKIEGGK